MCVRSLGQEDPVLSSPCLGGSGAPAAPGGAGIPVELFQILKDDAVKVLHSICQQIWKTQQWPQDWLERNPQLSLATRGEDWASQGQSCGHC